MSKDNESPGNVPAKQASEETQPPPLPANEGPAQAASPHGGESTRRSFLARAGKTLALGVTGAAAEDASNAGNRHNPDPRMRGGGGINRSGQHDHC